MRAFTILASLGALFSSTAALGFSLTPPLQLAQAEPAASPPQAPPTLEGRRVLRIAILGLQRVEPDAVRAVLPLKPGGILTKKEIQDDLHAIFNMGYFADGYVEANPVGEEAELIFHLTEKPAIRRVLFEGNDELGNDDLKDLVDLKAYSILNMAAVRRNQRKIHDKYIEKGFFLADVTFHLVPVPGNEVDVYYVIQEHAKVSVRRITFIGNKRLSTDELKAVMTTQEASWLSFLNSSGNYREELLERDVFMIQSLYYDHGFINVRIGKPKIELSADKRYIYIGIHIDEGEQFRLGKIDFSGDLLLSKPELMARLTIRPGEIFNRTKLLHDRTSIEEVYQDLGFAYANITPLTAIHEEDRTVDLNFEVQKGVKVYLERVEIAGNTKTRDTVIRREMRIYDGDLYSGSGIRLSKQRVQALGFFETVEIQTKKGSAEDLAVVVVTVKERPTGTFQVGAGFSTLESFIFTAQLSQNNLFGWGQTGSLTIQISSLRQLAQVQFVDPHFLDSNWTFAFDIFRTQLAYPGFVRNATGGDITFGYLISEFLAGPLSQVVGTRELWNDLRLFLTYNLQDIGLSPFSQGVQQLLLAHQFLTGVESSVRLTLTWDKRNDRLYPSSGFMASQSFEIAPSWLGSDFEFARLAGYIRVYAPLPLGAVFKTNWSYGYIEGIGGSPIPISEKYFVGGINSVRGYYLLSISPTIPVGFRTPDSATTPYEIGGNKQIVINNEVEFPIVEKIGIRGVLFYDLGNAYGENEPFFRDYEYPSLPLGLFESVGFGIRWFSPIGPLRFEWGFPLTPRPQDGPYDFEFTIGNFF
jgi:outer membrane protein insertion porin family